MSPNLHTQSPAVLRQAENFRQAFVRLSDWAVVSSSAFIGLILSLAWLGYAARWVVVDKQPEWLGVGLLMLGIGATASCVQKLKAIRGARALHRLGEPETSTLDQAKRKWFAEHFGVEPRDYITLAQELAAWRQLAATYAVTGLTPPKPNWHAVASASHRATSWATALVAVTVPLVATRQEAWDFIFANRAPLTVILVIATGYALLLLRGVPALVETIRELLGQMGLLHRGWPIDFLMRELVRLAEPVGFSRTRPRHVPEEAWLPL